MYFLRLIRGAWYRSGRGRAEHGGCLQEALCSGGTCLRVGADVWILEGEAKATFELVVFQGECKEFVSD